MSNAIFAVLSRQSGLGRELNAIANNIANADTTGFRREEAIFSEFVQALRGAPSASQTRLAARYLDAAQGAMARTDGALDIAIEGEGYFLVETPRGERLMRAGTFTLNENGEVATHHGMRVLGEGGSPIALSPDARRIVIANDGTISADDAPVGKIALVTAPPETLAREGEDLIRAEDGYEFLVSPRVAQGFLEDSNVSAVGEISRLIEVQRAYELNQQMLANEDDRIRRAVERLGQRS